MSNLLSDEEKRELHEESDEVFQHLMRLKAHRCGWTWERHNLICLLIFTANDVLRGDEVSGDPDPEHLIRSAQTLLMALEEEVDLRLSWAPFLKPPLPEDSQPF